MQSLQHGFWFWNQTEASQKEIAPWRLSREGLQMQSLRFWIKPGRKSEAAHAQASGDKVYLQHLWLHINGKTSAEISLCCLPQGANERKLHGKSLSISMWSMWNQESLQ